ncbi:MAG: hypothetical protein K2X54_27855 [Methylobacterium organophilum]|nr:hypothetical protein [Methylobacterium organophilum]
MSDQISLARTVRELGSLHAALRALDGYERVVRDPSGERVVRAAYTLDGLTRLAIADNMAAIEEVSATFEKARVGLLREHTGGADSFEATPEGEAAAQAFSEAVAPLFELEREIRVVPIPIASLKLDANPIPPSALSALRPILKRD